MAALLIGTGFGMYAIPGTAAWYAAGIAVWTMGEILTSPTSSSIVADLAPTHLRGRYQGVFMSFVALNFFLGLVFQQHATTLPIDMASHGVECARYLFGKDVPVREVFAWGATLVHSDRTTAEDNGVLLVRFADDRVATCDVSWSSKGGLEGRFEAYGDAGRMVLDMGQTPLRAFVGRAGGYVAEKTDLDAGWIFPVPDETYTHGHDAMLTDVIEAFRAARAPRETFRDGFAVNAILDAGYRSMRSGRWEAPVGLADALTGVAA